jgi:hypothetical protein
MVLSFQCFEIDLRALVLDAPDDPTGDFLSMHAPAKALIFAFHS